MMKVSGFYITILFIAMLMDPIHTLCQGNNEMDMIMFYDCDHGSLINNRPDNGWWHLNPEYPKDPTTENHHRITTSLLGTYESQDPAVIKQHAYWFQALGCNVFASDLTNIASVRAPGSSSSMESFYSGVLKAFENQLKELREIEEFDAPEVYPVLRLFGTTYGTFEYMLDDVYALYEKYPEKWYTLDDESEDSSKPFIVVFTDWTLLSNWASNGVTHEAKDDRFNIRWSNGFLLNTAGITETGTNGTRKIPGDVPFWLFVENEQTTNGRYQAVYKESPDKQSVEQMITWASVWLNGNEWDGLRDTIDGKLPIERYSERAFDLNPQTLLVNRFNYPLAWMGMPGEGVSRNKSTHIETNVDWGFLEFNDVAKVLYDIRGTEKAAPPAPLADSYNF